MPATSNSLEFQGGFSGQALREAREHAGLTTTQLGSILDVTASAVAKWESGEHHPRTQLLPVIAWALVIDICQLFTKQTGKTRG